jgi:SAM-dependent methyltransferase
VSDRDARRRAEEANRRLWNELTPVHERAYPVREFLAGQSTLKPVELAEVGDVAGKSLLHLQCHFGLDTLSWARRGASVTGVDISDESIELARRIAEQAGITARFIRSSVYDLDAGLSERFDIVYSSIGVLCWLGDIDEWARVAARQVAPGGFCYLYEAHPVLSVFDADAADLVPRRPYFHRAEPDVWPPGGYDYADHGYAPENPSHEWQWSLADVVNALLGAGLELEFLHEHADAPFDWRPGMERTETGWRLPGMHGCLPQAFSLRARPRR